MVSSCFGWSLFLFYTYSWLYNSWWIGKPIYRLSCKWAKSSFTQDVSIKGEVITYIYIYALFKIEMHLLEHRPTKTKKWIQLNRKLCSNLPGFHVKQKHFHHASGKITVVSTSAIETNPIESPGDLEIFTFRTDGSSKGWGIMFLIPQKPRLQPKLIKMTSPGEFDQNSVIKLESSNTVMRSHQSIWD